MRVKIQEVALNVAIDEKNEKQYVRQTIHLVILWTQGVFSDSYPYILMILLMHNQFDVMFHLLKKYFRRSFQINYTKLSFI